MGFVELSWRDGPQTVGLTTHPLLPLSCVPREPTASSLAPGQPHLTHIPASSLASRLLCASLANLACKSLIQTAWAQWGDSCAVMHEASKWRLGSGPPASLPCTSFDQLWWFLFLQKQLPARDTYLLVEAGAVSMLTYLSESRPACADGMRTDTLGSQSTRSQEGSLFHWGARGNIRGLLWSQHQQRHGCEEPGFWTWSWRWLDLLGNKEKWDSLGDFFLVSWSISKDSVWHKMKHSLGSSEVLFHICFAQNGTHSKYITFLNFSPPAWVKCVCLLLLPNALNDQHQAEPLRPGLILSASLSSFIMLAPFSHFSQEVKEWFSTSVAS